MDEQETGLILFMEDKRVLPWVAAQPVAEQLERSFGCIHGDVEQGLTVVRPFHARVRVDAAIGIDHKFGIQNAGYQILDVKGIHLTALDIQRIGKLYAIRADSQGSDTAKRLSFRQEILIEQDLLR